MVTRRDIAERLGVSVSVVSRALNGTGYVETEKRESILALARELGYDPRPRALQSAAHAAHSILFHCENLHNPFNIEMFEGVTARAAEQGYRAMLTRTQPDRAALSAVDGVIFSNEALAYDFLTGEAGKSAFPIVAASFGTNLSMPRAISIVDCDLWKGTELLVDALRSSGHERIAMVTPYPITIHNTRGIAWRACMAPVLGERLMGYYFGPEDDGGWPVDVREGGSPYDGFFENGMSAAESFLDADSDATAVIAFNEEMALGFLAGLRQRGVRVPEDLSVASYDGTFMRGHYDIPLAVLDLKPLECGRVCVDALLRRMRGGRAEKVRMQPQDILMGGTVRRI